MAVIASEDAGGLLARLAYKELIWLEVFYKVVMQGAQMSWLSMNIGLCLLCCCSETRVIVCPLSRLGLIAGLPDGSILPRGEGIALPALRCWTVHNLVMLGKPEALMGVRQASIRILETVGYGCLGARAKIVRGLIWCNLTRSPQMSLGQA